MARHLLQEENVFPVRESELELSIEPDPDAVYYLRPLTRDATREIAKKHTRQVVNRRTHMKDDVTDSEAVGDEVLDRTIVKWEGVTNGDGKPAPCDLAHKMKLPVVVQMALIDRASVGEDTDTKASFRPTS